MHTRRFGEKTSSHTYPTRERRAGPSAWPDRARLEPITGRHRHPSVGQVAQLLTLRVLYSRAGFPLVSKKYGLDEMTILLAR